MIRLAAFAISIFCFTLILISCACPSTTPAPPSSPPEPHPAPKPIPPPVPAPTPTPIPPPITELDTKYAMQLARQFCPIINLNDEPETGENFEPDPVQLMVDVAVIRDLENPNFSEKATIGNLLEWSQSEYYIDMIDLNPKEHSPAEYKAAYDSLKKGYQPAVYARVQEVDGTGHTVVQYWFFYYLNDWRNIHEGDWELIQLNFPGHTVKEILAKDEQPTFVAYSQHQSGQRMSWSDMNDKGLVKGTHPVVYVARGSHANYFTPGQFWSGLDFDDTGLSSWRTINPEEIGLILLGETEKKGLEWLQFKGYWGEYIGISVSVLGLRFWQHGPHGPLWSEEGVKSEKWENPYKWAAGLSEYPEPFWKSFLQLPGDCSELAIFSLFSPADLHVYDSMGRHVGINEAGELEKQIPGAIYITPEGTDYKTILIPDADVKDEYTIVAKGTASGTMDIRAQVPEAMTKLRRFLEYIGVPISVKTTAQTEIKPAAPGPRILLSPAEMLGGTTRDKTTVLEIDRDGDGVFEIESTPGNFEKQKVLRSVLNAKIDIKPDTLNIISTAIEKSITAYIELPVELSPKAIDVSTILLFGNIAALESPIDVTDHDQNGIQELVVKFDRQIVIDFLISTNQVEGAVVFTVNGIAKGQPFKGVDTISITTREQ